MDSYNIFPEIKLQNKGVVSEIMINLGIENLREAAQYIHHMEYGYNTREEDERVLFEDGRGTCGTKHASFAALAAEQNIDVKKVVGVYRLTEEVISGSDEILKKYNIPYIPLTHCYLEYEDFKVDLTEGNKNGKNTPIDEFIYTDRVDPVPVQKKLEEISSKGIKIALEELREVSLNNIFLAQDEARKLLKKNIL